MRDHRRVAVKSKDGYILYYDIDPDDKVYWLRIRKQGAMQRYRIKDTTLAAEIRRLANDAG